MSLVVELSVSCTSFFTAWNERNSLLLVLPFSHVIPKVFFFVYFLNTAFPNPSVEDQFMCTATLLSSLQVQ